MFRLLVWYSLDYMITWNCVSIYCLSPHMTITNKLISEPNVNYDSTIGLTTPFAGRVASPLMWMLVIIYDNNKLSVAIGTKSEAKVLLLGITANIKMSHRLWLWVSWVSYSYQCVYTCILGISLLHWIFLLMSSPAFVLIFPNYKNIFRWLKDKRISS